MRVALRRRLEALRSEPLSLAPRQAQRLALSHRHLLSTVVRSQKERSSTLAVARFWRALRCHPGSAAEVVVGNTDTRGRRLHRLQWLHP